MGHAKATISWAVGIAIGRDRAGRHVGGRRRAVPPGRAQLPLRLPRGRGDHGRVAGASAARGRARRERRALRRGDRARAARDLPTGSRRARPLRVAVDGTPLLGNRPASRVADGLLDRSPGRPDLDLVAYAITWRGRQKLAERLPPACAPRPAPFPARLVPRAVAAHDMPRIERWTGPVDVVHATFIGPPARSRSSSRCTTSPSSASRRCATRRRPAVRPAGPAGARPRRHVHAVSDFVAGEVREHFAIDDTRVVRSRWASVERRRRSGPRPHARRRDALRARARHGRAAEEPARARARLRPIAAARSRAAPRPRGPRRLGSVGVPGRVDGGAAR